MKKIIIYVTSAILVIYIAINIYAYHEIDDYSPLTNFHIKAPLKNNEVCRNYIAATFINIKKDSIFLCRYSWVHGYKYLFYEPQELSDDYTLVFDKVEENLLKGKVLKIIYSDSTVQMIYEPENKWISLNNIPQNIIILDSHSQFSEIYDKYKLFPNCKREISWYEKFTWGPITKL